MRVYLHTFGCKTNQYDSERVRQALERSGVTVVADPGLADAAVVNSCTVTHVGERRMRGLVRRLDRRRPGIRTVVMGCAAALDDGTIAGLPGVVSVQGGADPDGVLGALGLTAPVPDPLLRTFARGTRGWVKIQDGCDEHCTFCATTVARGANRSRDPDEVIAEALVLSEHHRELVLTGVHIGSYGRDRGGPSLSGLVERLVEAVPAARFRLSSIEATEVDDRLADLMRNRPARLVPHLHAPLQSGSDRILRRMGRHWYTAGQYVERLASLATMPVFGLGADIIVGFPGETTEDHRATCAVVEALPFTCLHVFPWSPRPGAPAVRLGRPPDPALVAERTAEVRELGRRSAAAYAETRPAMADVVLLDRGGGRARGLTEDYLDVTLDPSTPLDTRFAATVRVGPDGGWAAAPVAAGDVVEAA